MSSDEEQHQKEHDLGSNDPDYRVGYGRPPIATRFKKGRSGNPKGRPKANKTIGTLVYEALQEKVQIREGGSVRSRPKIEVAIQVSLNQALKGEPRNLLKLIELARKEGTFEPAVPPITEIQLVVVDPKEEPPTDLPADWNRPNNTTVSRE
jgi:hypothetical protein